MGRAWRLRAAVPLEIPLKNAIPIVVGIAAIAAAGWWISGSAESDAEAPARVNMEVLADGDRLAETDPGAPEITTNRRPENAPTIKAETYTRPDAAAEDMVSVELYRIDPDSGDERPVPNADVWFLPGDEETMVKAQAQMRSGATTLQVMRALGRLFRANSKGRADRYQRRNGAHVPRT